MEIKMKKAYFIIIVALTMLSACAKDGDFNIINRSHHNVYYTLDNNDYVLSGMQQVTHTLTTDKEMMFSSSNRDYLIHIEGEAFVLEDGEKEVTETTITIKPGKTLKAFLNPNRASLKIINHSNKSIGSLFYKQYYADHVNTSSEQIEEDILPNSSQWFRLPACTVNFENPAYFYYKFEVRDETGAVQYFGDESTVLNIDNQYVIEIE
jgi:hypothetical protein